MFLLCDIVRAALAKRALKGYPCCNDKRITAICAHCAQTIGLKKAPALYYGTLENPVCVTGAIRPALLMDKAIVERLNDTELSAVFFHELTHVKRRHLLWERIYDVVCLANWFNPFAWIARREFSLHCEMDCDDKALKASRGEMAQREYALAILRLLELSTIRATQPGRGAGALGFLLAKRRLQRITANLQRSGNGCYARHWRFRWRLRWRFPCGSAGNTFIPIRPIALARNIPRVAARDPFFSTIKLLL